MSSKSDFTLDILYTKKIKYFNQKFEVTIPKLNQTIEELELQRTPKNTADTDLKIESLKKKIASIKWEKDKYFLDNSKYLF